MGTHASSQALEYRLLPVYFAAMANRCDGYRSLPVIDQE
jgi:hypothetical protein